MIRIKRILVVLINVIFALQLQGCGSNSRFTVLDYMGNSDWIYDGIKVQKLNITGSEEKVIIFIGAGHSDGRKAGGMLSARVNAQLNAQASAAMAISGLFSKQTELIMKKLYDSEIQIFERGVEESFAKNVDVSQLHNISNFYRLVQSKEDSISAYQFYCRYAMPYEIYKKRRDEFLKEYSKKNLDFLNKYTPVASQLLQLDNTPDGGIGHIPLTPEERERRENIGIY